MPTAARDWKEMPDGREKYQAYLCSREWSVIRERVRKRSDGICERCFTNEMDHVHHLTYERKYKEEMEDLQAICKPCHEFTHGKSDSDPVRTRPVRVIGMSGLSFGVRSFYLAGKITGTCWRGEIVDDWEYENHSRAYLESGLGDSDGQWWRRVACAAESVFGVFLDYTGPWWFDPRGGCHTEAMWCRPPHAYAAEDCDKHGMPCGTSDENRDFIEPTVSGCVQRAISDADLLFAWIDSDDCLGTMLEVGMARAKGKLVVVASPPTFDARETWLARSVADVCVLAPSAGDAWKHFWQNLKEAPLRVHKIISSRRIK